MKKRTVEKDTKLYFMPIGMVTGMCLGLIIGYNIKNIAVSLSIATLVGAGLGFVIDYFRK